MNKPKDESNFLFEITPPLLQRIREELGDAFDNNSELHYSPYWKMMKEREEEDD